MSSVVLDRLRESTVLRFALVGCANTAVGFSAIMAARWLLQLDDVTANVVGYACGLLLSFVLNRRFTFRHRGRIGGAMARYVLAFAISYGVNMGVLLLALHFLALPSVAAQALAVCSYTAVFYVLSRKLVFV